MAVAGAATAALGLFLLASPETAVVAAADVGAVGGRRGAESGGAAAAGGAREGGRGGDAAAFDTVLMVDAGSSGSRLNVYRLDREVRGVGVGGRLGAMVHLVLVIPGERYASRYTCLERYLY